ncbi:MAG: hypothetical protein KC503_10440 [Myxococcales bacterium]|nr:hypothetical protein [Myxococcales bacterium]
MATKPPRDRAAPRRSSPIDNLLFLAKALGVVATVMGLAFSVGAARDTGDLRFGMLVVGPLLTIGAIIAEKERQARKPAARATLLGLTLDEPHEVLRGRVRASTARRVSTFSDGYAAVLAQQAVLDYGEVLSRALRAVPFQLETASGVVRIDGHRQHVLLVSSDSSLEDQRRGELHLGQLTRSGSSELVVREGDEVLLLRATDFASDGQVYRESVGEPFGHIIVQRTV